MKRKYGAALKRETIAEKGMREAAAAMHDNRYNFGSKASKGAVARGKKRGRAFKHSYLK